VGFSIIQLFKFLYSITVLPDNRYSLREQRELQEQQVRRVPQVQREQRG
jgi:hypothetical protein